MKEVSDFYLEPVQSSSNLHSIFKIQFNIILPSPTRYPKWSLPTKFPKIVHTFIIFSMYYQYVVLCLLHTTS